MPMTLQDQLTDIMWGCEIYSSFVPGLAEASYKAADAPTALGKRWAETRDRLMGQLHVTAPEIRSTWDAYSARILGTMPTPAPVVATRSAPPPKPTEAEIFAAAHRERVARAEKEFRDLNGLDSSGRSVPSPAPVPTLAHFFGTSASDPWVSAANRAEQDLIDTRSLPSGWREQRAQQVIDEFVHLIARNRRLSHDRIAELRSTMLEIAAR
jgi:hypothetical protein